MDGKYHLIFITVISAIVLALVSVGYFQIIGLLALVASERIRALAVLLESFGYLATLVTITYLVIKGFVSISKGREQK